MARKEFDQKVNKEMGTQEDELSAAPPDPEKKDETDNKKKSSSGKEEVKDIHKEAKTMTVNKKKDGGKTVGCSPATPPTKGTPKDGKPKCEPTKEISIKGKKESSPEHKKERSLVLSAYGPANPKSTPKDYQWLEEYVTKMSCFHGFIGREDLNSLLQKPGDYLIRTSVQPNKHEVEKRKKNKEDVKVLVNLSREKCAKKEKEKEKEKEKANGAGDIGRREFVISVFCKDKEKPAPGKPVFTPIRNLVIKRDSGQIHIEPLKKFKTMPDFFAYYSKNVGVCKETDFQLLNAIPLSTWEFVHEDIELQSKKLGEGAFGEVRVGKMKVKTTKKTVEVAVKMLRNSKVVTREQVSELLHEARVMRLMDHKNVLRSYGIAVVKEPLYLMTELCACGALREYLRENHDTVTLADKLAFVLGSARGVEYLHSQKTIHRDLAVRNILLTEDKTPKVSDFGLAKVTDLYEMKEQCKIPVRYLAPETLENFIFTPKTDVFSFGCVIWEIYENGNQPHDGRNAVTIRNLTKKNQFLQLTRSSPPELRKLVAERVFTADPENRCTMTTIVQCVEKIEKPATGVK